MVSWEIERIVRFGPGDLCKDSFVHFGFHDRTGKQYALEHQEHFLGPVGLKNKLEWTLSHDTVFQSVPNIRADVKFPMYIDSMHDNTLVTSNFGSGLLYRIHPAEMRAELFVDGPRLGMKDVGNCVVDDEGCVWVNEVTGCRIWRFDRTGNPLLTLGDGMPGFQSNVVGFEKVRFNWIYDIRRGPDGSIYVLDSKNFALRMIDRNMHQVHTLAGNGKPGYAGDGKDARLATFGSNPNARFDGPISLSIDEAGNIYVGDRYNHVVRMIHAQDGTISSIAGSRETKDEDERPNNPGLKDPYSLSLPKISSMDYYDGRLFIPTDLSKDVGDLVIMRKQR